MFDINDVSILLKSLVKEPIGTRRMVLLDRNLYMMINHIFLPRLRRDEYL